jgi:undecaprenyl phosphate-alpha-L-ara4N flippase subunit ArnE
LGEPDVVVGDRYPPSVGEEIVTMVAFKPLLGIAGMVALTVGANLMLKLGAMVAPAQRALFGILSWQSVVGLALFGAAGIIYAFVLRAVPLHVAQAFTAFQYVAVVMAASFLLRERISLTSWIGIACIVVGILLVGSAIRT